VQGIRTNLIFASHVIDIDQWAGAVQSAGR
jgi:hypothetical protein